MPDNSLLISRARAAVMARDFALAARLYKQLLRDQPDNIEYLNKLGELYMKSGRDDQALPVFKRVAELNPEDAKPFITMGGIYRRLKKYEESIAVLEQALIADGNNAQISYNLGFTYKSMGELDDAISCFEDAVEMNPDDVLAYNHLGAIYAQQGDHDKAVQSYLRGLNIDANHPILLLNIAKSYEALGDYEKACASYEGALRSKPLWIEGIDGYARLLISTNKAKSAYNLVKRAISVAPKDKKLQNALENVKKYVDVNMPASDAITAPEPIQVPSLFKDEDMQNSDEDFEAGGLEIPMNNEETAQIEETAAEQIDTELKNSPRELPYTENDDFDFNSMGMDVLKDDAPLDPMFFEDSDANLAEPESEVKNLDDLLEDDENPVDTDDSPITPLDDGFDDDVFADGDFAKPMDDEIPDEELSDAQEEPSQEQNSNYEEIAKNLAEQVEKAQETLEKANYAAEKAWNAAQQAADAAQALESLNLVEPDEEAEPEIEDNLESDFEENETLELEDFTEENAEESNIETEPNLSEVENSDAFEEISKAAQMLPGIIDNLENPDAFEQFKKQLELFKKLREMLSFLPDSQKDSFFSSRTRLLLDYIISRLSGVPGLCGTADALIACGAVTPWQNDGSKPSKEGDELIREVISIMIELVGSIKDENLKTAMLHELAIYNA